MLKILVLVMLAVAFYQLAMAFRYFLQSDTASKQKMVTALAWRITFSLLVFVALLIAFAMGWIAPSASLNYLIN